MISAEFLQSGSFNIRMLVEEPVETPDGCGGYETVWQPAFDAWVRLIPVKSILVNRASEQEQDTTHWIILRKRPELSRHMRFAAIGDVQRIFEIDTIRDPDETGRYWLCQVREIE